MQQRKQREKSRTSIVLEILFMAAALTCMIGMVVYNPILNSNEFLTKGVEHAHQVVPGALFELYRLIEQFSETGQLQALPIFLFEMTLAVLLIKNRVQQL